MLGALCALEAGGYLLAWGPAASAAVFAVGCAVAGALLLMHAAFALYLERGVCLLAAAAAVGFAAEAVSVHTSVSVFGGRYVYHMPGPRLLGVPLAVILFWAVFIYDGYSITNSFAFWLGRAKPTRADGGAGRLAGLIALDGLLVVAIDLMVDPLQVNAGNWVWLDRGPYYGIPAGNFVGWFGVTVAVTGPFRVFEYLRPRPNPDAAKVPVQLLPILCYAALYLVLASWALSVAMPWLAVVGALTMGSVVAANLVLLFLRRPAPAVRAESADMPSED